MIEKRKHWRRVIWDARDQETLLLAKQLNITLITASILKLRGIKSLSEAKVFINPEIANLYPPILLKDIDKANQRIKTAIKRNEKILLYGDYDVDGISGVALLMQALKAMGAQVSYYLPSRFVEGYGLSMMGVKAADEQGVSLIVTVDCGIGAVEEVKAANQLGIDVIITDHHEVKSELPPALAIVNPNQKDCTYPNKSLAGVGVAMKLACEVMGLSSPPDSFIELACLGTIADVMPITGENRIIVHHGLKQLSMTKNVGWHTLVKTADLSDKKRLTVGDISFKLAPRLNAAGRLEDAQLALRLLLTPSLAEAQQIAEILNEKNIQRQQIQKEIFEQAQREIEIDDSKPVIIIAGQQWHQGVIGIVASKLVDTFHRPVIVISCENGIGKGSGRSIPCFHLLKAMEGCDDLFLSYGGHSQAAGLTIETTKINLFQERINDYASQILTTNDLVSGLEVMEIDIDEVNFKLVNELDNLLAPFGLGNPWPVFSSRDLQLSAQPRIVGNNHLKIKVRGKKATFDAIGFSLGKVIEELERIKSIDVAYVPQINNWQGLETLQLNLKDIKATS